MPGNAPISLSTVYTETTPQSIESLQFALANSRIVDIDVGVDLTASDAVWESFEDLLMKATADLPQHAPIVLCKSTVLDCQPSILTNLHN